MAVRRRAKVVLVLVALLLVSAVVLTVFYDRLFYAQIDRAQLARDRRLLQVPAKEVKRAGSAVGLTSLPTRYEQECPADSGRLLRQPGAKFSFKTTPGEASAASDQLVAELTTDGWDVSEPAAGSLQPWRDVQRSIGAEAFQGTLYTGDTRLVLTLAVEGKRACTEGILMSSPR